MSTSVARKPTLKDVAALAGVSVASASLVLGGRPTGEETRRKVLDAARQLGYVANAGARELRTGTPTSVAMWVLNRSESEELSETNSFFYALIRGALDELDRAGYSFSFRVGDHPAAGVADAFAVDALSGRYRGLILIPQWVSDGAYLRAVERAGIPHVTLNEARSVPANVRLDHAEGIRQALRHLQEAGHRNIAYLAGPPGHLDAEERLAAFYRYAAETGMHVREDRVVRSGFSVDAGREGMHALLGAATSGARDQLTAVLAANDYAAAGALRACAEAGVRVPDDLSLIGFDDVDVARATLPALTTIRQPLRELGAAAARAVLALANDEVPEPVVIRPQLIERDSVKRA